MTEQGELYERMRKIGKANQTYEGGEEDTVDDCLEVLDEAAAENPLNFSEDQWQQFIDNSDKEWLIKVLNAAYKHSKKWFGGVR